MEDHTDTSAPPRRFDPKPLAAGVVLVVVGILLTLGQLGIDTGRDLWRIWPVGLLLLAGGVAVNGRTVEAWRKAAWIGFVGCWLLVNFYHLLGFDFGNSWPLFVIFAGLVELVVPEHGSDRLGGLIPLLVGTWLLANARRLFGLEWQSSWPLLLVLLGTGILIQAVGQHLFRRKF